VEIFWLEQVQSLVQLAILPIAESFHLLRIRVYVMPAILAQGVKLLGVTVHRIRPLPKGQQLPHLFIH
jgi:hypothetical protein